MKIKRLVPAGKKASGKTVTSLKLARKLTTVFHGLLTEREVAVKGVSASSKADVVRIDAEIASFGGREAYQEASALSTRTFRSSRWIFKTLTRFGVAPTKGELPLRVLEIGAVNAQLAVCPWLKVRAIDIRSSDPAVEQKDFFDVPIGSGPTGTSADVLPATVRVTPTSSLPTTTTTVLRGRDRVWGATPSRLRTPNWNPTTSTAATSSTSTSTNVTGKKRQRDEDAVPLLSTTTTTTTTSYDESAYNTVVSLQGIGPVRILTSRAPIRPSKIPITGAFDIVVCAMVLNCVFEPVARARMLIAARDHLSPGGLLYFAVPSRCLDKSEFLTRTILEGLFKSIGFEKRSEKRTPKISFYLLERIDILPANRFQSSGGGGGGDGELTVAPGYGHGTSWNPRITPINEKERNLLTTRLPDPPRTLPLNLLPVTGFSRTTFSISIPPTWYNNNNNNTAGGGDASGGGGEGGPVGRKK